MNSQKETIKIRCRLQKLRHIYVLPYLVY